MTLSELERLTIQEINDILDLQSEYEELEAQRMREAEEEAKSNNNQ